MPVISESTLVHACRTLFGDHIEINRDFLSCLQSSGVKSAFRRKARENHPDFFASAPAHVQEQQAARLRQIIEAYDLMNRFFEQRSQGRWKPRQSPAGDRDTMHASAAPSSSFHGDPHAFAPRYYTGVMPPRMLQIGKYLFFRGRISYQALTQAVQWQRQQRPTVGGLAVAWGLLDQAACDRVSRLCGTPWLFGKKAIELGLLTADQVSAIETHQNSLEPRLGTYFVLKKILARDEIEALEREHQEHNAAVRAAASRRRSQGRT